MINLYLVKLCGLILELKFSIWAERNGCETHYKRIYYYFVDFWKAFDIELQAQLMQS